MPLNIKMARLYYLLRKRRLKVETITPYTATKLQRLLREVVTNNEGTGRWFQNLPYEVAGKSGTGETGKYFGDQQLHNKWFAGYFPYNKPKYALVVVNLDVLADEGGVNLLFADMVKVIYEYDQNDVELKPLNLLISLIL